MEDSVLVQCLRKLGFSVVVPSLLPLLLSTPAAALPTASSAEPSGSPSGLQYPHRAAEDTTPHLSLAFLRTLQPVASSGLELPPLRNPDAFLPVPAPQIRLILRLADRRLYVYDQEQVKISFPVAVGRQGWETPTGKYQVIQMEQNPIWQHPFTGELVPPGAGNPLGVRWIGFWTDGTNYIGFHGTPNEETVGQAASHGCVRMYNQDVIKLFEMVKIGTPVEVVP